MDESAAHCWRIEHVPVIGSTNAEVISRAGGGEAAGLVLVADHQTAGRGRLDRSWVTPSGEALTFSALVDPAVPDDRWPWLPLLVGLAVGEAVRRTTGVRTTLKWPNDVLVGDRKLAGILVERTATPERPLAVVGIGINVRQQVLPVETATSLAREGAPTDRNALLLAVLARLEERLVGWCDVWGDHAALHTAYVRACGTLGRDVVVRLPGEETLTGHAESVDDLGRLVVRTPSGVPRHVAAGDVVQVR